MTNARDGATSLRKIAPSSRTLVTNSSNIVSFMDVSRTCLGYC